jgi:hypothetical protein
LPGFCNPVSRYLSTDEHKTNNQIQYSSYWRYSWLIIHQRWLNGASMEPRSPWLRYWF